MCVDVVDRGSVETLRSAEHPGDRVEHSGHRAGESQSVVEKTGNFTLHCLHLSLGRFIFNVIRLRLGLRLGLRLRLSEKSERAGEAGAEDSTEAEGDKAGEDALEEERLRSTGWD